MREPGKLYYHGTDLEVRLGDRIRLRRLLRKAVFGVVAYLPGVSPPHPEMLWDDGVPNWAIRLNSGDLIAWVFLPHELQPESKIELVERNYAKARLLEDSEEFH